MTLPKLSLQLPLCLCIKTSRSHFFTATKLLLICLPINDVTGPKQCGCIDDRVPCCTCSVELRILTNQMTGQESAVRPAHHNHPVRVKSLVTLQDMQHGPLGKRNRWDRKGDKKGERKKKTFIDKKSLVTCTLKRLFCRRMQFDCFMVQRQFCTNLHVFDILTADVSKQRINTILTKASGTSIIN